MCVVSGWPLLLLLLPLAPALLLEFSVGLPLPATATAPLREGASAGAVRRTPDAGVVTAPTGKCLHACVCRALRVLFKAAGAKVLITRRPQGWAVSASSVNTLWCKLYLSVGIRRSSALMLGFAHTSTPPPPPGTATGALLLLVEASPEVAIEGPLEQKNRVAHSTAHCSNIRTS